MSGRIYCQLGDYMLPPFTRTWNICWIICSFLNPGWSNPLHGSSSLEQEMCPRMWEAQTSRTVRQRISRIFGIFQARQISILHGVVDERTLHGFWSWGYDAESFILRDSNITKLFPGTLYRYLKLEVVLWPHPFFVECFHTAYISNYYLRNCWHAERVNHFILPNMPYECDQIDAMDQVRTRPCMMLFKSWHLSWMMVRSIEFAMAPQPYWGDDCGFYKGLQETEISRVCIYIYMYTHKWVKVYINTWIHMKLHMCFYIYMCIHVKIFTNML